MCREIRTGELIQEERLIRMGGQISLRQVFMTWLNRWTLPQRTLICEQAIKALQVGIAVAYRMLIQLTHIIRVNLQCIHQIPWILSWNIEYQAQMLITEPEQWQTRLKTISVYWSRKSKVSWSKTNSQYQSSMSWSIRTRIVLWAEMSLWTVSLRMKRSDSQTRKLISSLTSSTLIDLARFRIRSSLLHSERWM